MFRLLYGDCRHVLAMLGPESIDAIVSDPPYEIGFMGRKWDNTGIAYDRTLWEQVYRVLKPGGYVVSFGATRTYHRMAVAIEDAGFEVRDSLHWIYGSGMPKSMDIAKAYDKEAGTWRGRAGALLSENHAMTGGNYARTPKGEPVTEAGWAWKGWGTNLKPGHEPFVLARKPIPKTLLQNIEAYGLGGLNIDACRMAFEEGEVDFSRMQRQQQVSGAIEGAFGAARLIGTEIQTYKEGGRWPANIVLTHSADCGTECQEDCPVGRIEAQVAGASRYFPVIAAEDSDAFYYSAKVSRAERDAGCENLPSRTAKATVLRDPETPGAKNGRAGANRGAGAPLYYCAACNLSLQGGRAASVCPVSLDGEHVPEARGTVEAVRNHHPTVKPTKLMEWCVKLVCPRGGTVLDPFMGSGSTGIAAANAGMRFIGIEQNPEYYDIARARVSHAHDSRD